MTAVVVSAVARTRRPQSVPAKTHSTARRAALLFGREAQPKWTRISAHRLRAAWGTYRVDERDRRTLHAPRVEFSGIWNRSMHLSRDHVRHGRVIEAGGRILKEIVDDHRGAVLQEGINVCDARRTT